MTSWQKAPDDESQLQARSLSLFTRDLWTGAVAQSKRGGMLYKSITRTYTGEVLNNRYSPVLEGCTRYS